MSIMDDQMMIIKHLVMMLEERDNKIKSLERELDDFRNYVWTIEHPLSTSATGEKYNIDPSSVSCGKSACDGGYTYTDIYPLGTDRYGGSVTEPDPGKWMRLGTVYRKIDKHGNVTE